MIGLPWFTWHRLSNIKVYSSLQSDNVDKFVSTRNVSVSLFLSFLKQRRNNGFKGVADISSKMTDTYNSDGMRLVSILKVSLLHLWYALWISVHSYVLNFFWSTSSIDLLDAVRALEKLVLHTYCIYLSQDSLWICEIWWDSGWRDVLCCGGGMQSWR